MTDKEIIDLIFDRMDMSLINVATKDDVKIIREKLEEHIEKDGALHLDKKTWAAISTLIVAVVTTLVTSLTGCSIVF